MRLQDHITLMVCEGNGALKAATANSKLSCRVVNLVVHNHGLHTLYIYYTEKICSSRQKVVILQVGIVLLWPWQTACIATADIRNSLIY